MSVVTRVIDEATIRARVRELGEQITEDYEGREPVLLGLLNGSVPFIADLSRALPPELDIDFLCLTRFGNRGRVSIAMDAATSISGRHVLIVEDLVDTGLTLSFLLGLLETRGPTSLATVTLLDKRPRRIVEVPLAYRGFEVGDEFLLGYGLDWEGRFRNLRDLWAVLDLAAFQDDPESVADRLFGEQGRAGDKVNP